VVKKKMAMLLDSKAHPQSELVRQHVETALGNLLGDVNSL